MIRRYGEAINPAMRYTPRPGAYVILERDGALLLTLESLRDNEVQLPGGGVDPGENPISALHREVMEETGWHMARPRRIGVYRRFTFMPEYDLWAEKICTLYLSRPTLRIGEPLEKHHTPLWCPIAAAPDILDTPGDAEMVRQLYGL